MWWIEVLTLIGGCEGCEGSNFGLQPSTSDTNRTKFYRSQASGSGTRSGLPATSAAIAGAGLGAAAGGSLEGFLEGEDFRLLLLAALALASLPQINQWK